VLLPGGMQVVLVVVRQRFPRRGKETVKKTNSGEKSRIVQPEAGAVMELKACNDEDGDAKGWAKRDNGLEAGSPGEDI
jgi:hypothetical protein